MTDHVSQTRDTYNRIADDYAVNLRDYTPEVERSKFLSLIPSGGSILDLGCAAGRDTIYFSSKGFRTVGVDLSEKLLAIARESAPELTFVHGDIRSLTFPSASFDGIWACAVLLHLTRKDTARVLRDCYAFLKPDGLLCVIVKSGQGEADVAEPLSNGLTRHFVYSTPDGLQRMVTGAGFTVTELYTWNSKDRFTPARDVEWITCFAKKV